MDYLYCSRSIAFRKYADERYSVRYMAPYEGDIAKNDVNKLKFFKIAERAVSNQAKWATDEMMYASLG
jgi:hypothetical protein